MNYQQQTLAVMNSVELVVSLYDGMTRFLYRAISSVEAGDVAGRRDSIRRVLEILTYLQARLRMDVGGEPALMLADFYAAMYAQCVRASRDASIPLLEKSINEIRNVRDAWKQIAAGDGAASVPGIHLVPNSASAFPPAVQPSRVHASAPGLEESPSRNWSA